MTTMITAITDISQHFLKKCHEKTGLKVQLNLFYRTSAFYGADDFSLSDDGKTITIWVSTGDRTSYPYLRSMSVKEDFGTLYLTFRPTFFGKLGAQDTFCISLQDGQTRIIVDDPNEPYNIGLFWKPESGWQTTRFRVLNSNN